MKNVLYRYAWGLLVLACCAGPGNGWAQSSTAFEVMQVLGGAVNATDEPAPAENVASEASDKAELCPLPPMRVYQRCESGGTFLCVDTPPGGVVDAAFALTGKIDESLDRFAGLHITVQHDATKTTATHGEQLGLAADGSFSVPLSLSQLGSYTITVRAARASGKPVQQIVQMSRVLKPSVEKARVSVTPAPNATDSILHTDNVQIELDMFAGCQHCDLIGSATGGTQLRVRNTVTSTHGKQQVVERVTDLAKSGVYRLCMPTQTGTNQLEMDLCNAATGEQCVALDPMTLQVRDSQLRIVVDEPLIEQQAIYDARSYPTVPLQFRVEGLGETAANCSDAVQVEVNRSMQPALCPDADGVYALDMTPQAGVNLAIIRVRHEHIVHEYPITFGWGDIQSPWTASGTLKDPAELWFPDALTLGVQQDYLANAIRSLINHMAQGDGFADMLQTLFEPSADVASTPEDTARAAYRDEMMAQIRESIPHCASEEGASNMVIALSDRPQIGAMEITRLAFGDDEAQLSLRVQDLRVLVRYYRDNDKDGQPDAAVLPLKVAFRELEVHPRIRLVRGEEPLVLFTAETTNCDFRDAKYCEPNPAILIPDGFVGAANATGDFVQCDYKEQAIAPEWVEGCKSLNIVNGHLGLLGSTVLDALNETLYCTGSTALTYALREGAQNYEVQLGCPPLGLPHDPATAVVPIGSCEAASTGILADRFWQIPVGLNLTDSILQGNDVGMWARVASRVGSPQFFAGISSELRHAHTGYLTRPGAVKVPSDPALAGQRNLFAGVSTNYFNQLLFLLMLQGETPHAREVFGDVLGNGGGLLDWDIHEPLLQSIGFDPVRDCDQAAEPHSMCPIRPRASELLGPAISSEGYLTADHPIMLRMRGSRRIMPRLRFFRDEVPVPITEEGQLPSTRPAQLVELQIPDVDLSFYALARDESGQVQLDALGHPIIQSMLPESADPLYGYIVRARATVILALEIVRVGPDPLDPQHLQVVVRTEPSLTRIAFAADQTTNNTVIPTRSLLTALQEKLNYGIALFAGESVEDAIAVSLPKRVILGSPGTMPGMLGAFGVQEIRLHKDNFQFGVDPGQDFFTFGGNIDLIQRLRVGGELQEWVIGN